MLSDFHLDMKTFANIGLTTHNRFRKIHAAQPLKLDQKLCLEALQYATKLTYLGYLKHRDTKELKDKSENLAMGCYDNDSEMSAEDAVTRW